MYLETDPVTAELQRLANGDEPIKTIMSLHDVFVTYGENYGRPADSAVPLSGLTFLTGHAQPIDLAQWTNVFNKHTPYYTDPGRNYRQDGSNIKYHGDVFRWSKHHEWERVVTLPSRTPVRFQRRRSPGAPRKIGLCSSRTVGT